MSKSFYKDLKKHGLSPELIDIWHHFVCRKPLPKKYKDHPLSGNMKGCRDCHVKNDLVLIYEILDKEIFDDQVRQINLIRLGSHSEVFGDS